MGDGNMVRQDMGCVDRERTSPQNPTGALFWLLRITKRMTQAFTELTTQQEIQTETLILFHQGFKVEIGNTL